MTDKVEARVVVRPADVPADSLPLADSTEAPLTGRQKAWLATRVVLKRVRFISLASVLAICFGGLPLVGWVLNIFALKSILPGWVSVQPNAALAFVLTGIALLFSSRPPSILSFPPSTLRTGLSRLCALLAGLIGLRKLSDYVFGWNAGFGQWPFREPAGGVGSSHPGCMTPDTALCFVLLAAALWITSGSRKTHGASFASGILGLLVTTLAVAAMPSYFAPDLDAHGWWGFAIMPVPTATTFAVLGLAIILVTWKLDILSWSLGKKTTVAFAGGLSLLVVIGLNTSRSVVRLIETDRRIARGEQVLRVTANILAEVARAQANTRGYAVTGDEKFVKSYLAARTRCSEELAELRRLSADNPQRQQHSARLETQITAALKWRQLTIETRRRGSAAAAAQRALSGHGQSLMDNVNATIEQMRNEEHRLFQQHQRESESMARFTHAVIIAGTVVSLVFFLIALFGLNRAVTERTRAEEDVRQLNVALEQRVEDRTAELRAANHELEAFSYSVSHDLRAPLRAVHGYASILRNEHAAELDSEGQRILGNIVSEGVRMGRLIDDLLAFFRLGREKPRRSLVDMEALARTVFAELAEREPGRMLRPSLEPLPPAYGDPAMLRQVWVNLLANAIKYTSPRAVAEINIGSRTEGEESTYFVQDNGVGFDMKYAGKLFGVFQRLHSGAEFEGTGVGLALVQRILHRHGGRAWADARLDAGATFFFTLPRA